MASILSHAAIGCAIGIAFAPREAHKRYALLGGASAMLPDLDTLAGLVWRPGSDLLGHRGLSHSIAFSVAAAILFSLLASRIRRWQGRWRRLLCCVSLATMSHGLVDTTTTYGRGVALLAPFSAERFVSPFQPLGTARLRGSYSRTGRIAALVLNELMWLWVPAASFALTVRAARRRYSQET